MVSGLPRLIGAGPIWRLLRAHQWSKNLLVFAPAICAGHHDALTILRTLVGFVSLSLVASSLYVLNDVVDANKDRLHPLKRHRPIAAGLVTVRTAVVVAVAVALCGLALAVGLGRASLLAMIIYAVASASYSLVACIG